MRNFERDVIDRLGRIETKLDADYRVLHGNGHPGLVEKTGDHDKRILALENAVKSAEAEDHDKRIQVLEDAMKAAEKNGRRRLEWLAILITMAGVIVSLIKHS